MPDMYDLKTLKKHTQVKGLIHCKQAFPWPMAHRDLCFYATGMVDFKNKAAISVSQSVPEDKKYFGFPIPKIP